MTLTFSEDVTGVDLADFSLTRDGAAVALAGLTQVSASEYTLDLNDESAADGSYVLSLNAAGSGIVDGVGNALTGNVSVAWKMAMAAIKRK